MVYDMLAVSPNLRWISRVEADVGVSRLINRIAVHDHATRMAHGKRRSRWLSPSEAYVWWDRQLPRFAGATTGELAPNDISSAEVERVSRAIRKLARGNRVFLNKNTRNGRRIRVLASLPDVDVRFLHVVRHPLAVARSLTRVQWWPHTPLWFRGGETPNALAASDEDHLTLAAELWCREMQCIEGAIANGYTALTVRYEDVVKDPRSVGAQVAEFASSDRPSFVGEIAARFVTSARAEDWRHKMPRATQQRLWTMVAQQARTWGYEQ